MSEQQDPALSQLGQQVEIPASPQAAVLETIANPEPGDVYLVRFTCPEFTVLCPITGQPDFARIFINYMPRARLVESKSLKLYLFSFRNHGDFHEDCVQTICNDLDALIAPGYLEVIGEFTPRGGIAIYPFSSTHSAQRRYQRIYLERLGGYAPGKYTMGLGRPY